MAENKGGRPTIYTPEVADGIAERIAEGDSLRKICALENMPSTSTLCRWLKDNDEFRELYVWAREARAQIEASEIVEIADEASNDTVNIAKLRIDARKWVAARLLREYKDKSEVSTPDGQPLFKVYVGVDTEEV